MIRLPSCRRLVWRLRVVMAERDIRTITHLAHLLGERGIEISTQQLTRVVNDIPSRLSIELLAGLIEVLDCGVEDIIMVTSEPKDEPKAAGGNTDRAPSRPPRKRRPGSPTARTGSQNNGDESLTGPVVRPFLLPGSR